MANSKLWSFMVEKDRKKLARTRICHASRRRQERYTKTMYLDPIA